MAKFNVKTNFLEYRGIIRAMKNSFGTALIVASEENLCHPFIPFNFRLLLTDTKGSTRICNCLTSAKKMVYKFIDKWERKLKVKLNHSTWMALCNIPFQVTNDTKLGGSSIDY